MPWTDGMTNLISDMLMSKWVIHQSDKSPISRYKCKLEWSIMYFGISKRVFMAVSCLTYLKRMKKLVWYDHDFISRGLAHSMSDHT